MATSFERIVVVATILPSLDLCRPLSNACCVFRLCKFFELFLELGALFYGSLDLSKQCLRCTELV